MLLRPVPPKGVIISSKDNHFFWALSSSMDTAQWPSEVVVKPMEEIVVANTCSSKTSLERRVRPQKEQALNCPRCNSTNTKFCYYNNYSLSQPRYFCKTCRRYWTDGGSLRNIPVGGGSRKNKRSSSSSSSSSAVSSKKLPDLVPPTSCSQSSSQNPKIHEAQDLNLAFPSSTHDFKTISELIQVPDFDINGKTNMPCSSSSTSSHLSALELLTGISSRGLNSFMPMPLSDPNSIYSTGFSLQDFKPSLSFSLDGIGSSPAYGGLPAQMQEASGKLLCPFEDLKRLPTTTDVDQNREQPDSTGYWSGMFSGGSW